MGCWAAVGRGRVHGMWAFVPLTCIVAGLAWGCWNKEYRMESFFARSRGNPGPYITLNTPGNVLALTFAGWSVFLLLSFIRSPETPEIRGQKGRNGALSMSFILNIMAIAFVCWDRSSEIDSIAGVTRFVDACTDLGGSRTFDCDYSPPAIWTALLCFLVFDCVTLLVLNIGTYAARHEPTPAPAFTQPLYVTVPTLPTAQVLSFGGDPAMPRAANGLPVARPVHGLPMANYQPLNNAPQGQFPYHAPYQQPSAPQYPDTAEEAPPPYMHYDHSAEPVKGGGPPAYNPSSARSCAGCNTPLAADMQFCGRCGRAAHAQANLYSQVDQQLQQQPHLYTQVDQQLLHKPN